MFRPATIDNTKAKTSNSILFKKENESNAFVQPKLNIGKSNDKYELEADRVADKVVNSISSTNTKSFFPSSPTIQTQSEPELQKQEDTEQIQEKPTYKTITPLVQMSSDDEELIQEKCEDCQTEDEKIQTKTNGNLGSTRNLETMLNSSRGGGQKLDNHTRASMEQGFRADFSNVNIHINTSAIQMNKQLGAIAFTNGNDIYFNQGQYNVNSKSGQHLLAHELTHTIQQGTEKAIYKRSADEVNEPGRPVLANFTQEDIRQGNLSDCFLMAVLLSLTNNESGRSVLRNNIIQINESRYRVKLHRIRGNHQHRTFEARWVYVNYHTRGPGAIHAAPWVRVYEQAYAQFYGGMEVIGGERGGTGIGGPGRAFEHITGRPASTVRISGQENTNAIYERITRALESGRHVVAGTPRRLRHSRNLPGVFGGHNYAVVGFHENDNGRYLHIRNPWGSRFQNREQASQFRPQGYSDNPEFMVSFEEFQRAFVQIAIDNLPQQQNQGSASAQGQAPQQPSWSQRYEELLIARRGGSVPRRMLGGMLMEAIQEVNTPSSLTAISPVPADILMVRTIGGTNDILASTQITNAYHNPTNYWRWIAFTPGAISETKAFTIGIIEHELQHCADINQDLSNFNARSSNGTVEDFVDYTKDRSQSDIRHMEIYAQQASPERFALWSATERITWLNGALIEMPINLSSSQTLPIDRRVSRFYETASATRKREILSSITDLVGDLIHIDRTSDEYNRVYGRAVTALNHFRDIWDNNRRAWSSLRSIMQRRQPINR